MDALTAPYLAQPVSGRLFFAGEATSTDRFGYVDGAFETGEREAMRIGGLCSAGELPPYTPTQPIAARPENDAQLRQAWYQLVKDYVL